MKNWTRERGRGGGNMIRQGFGVMAKNGPRVRESQEGLEREPGNYCLGSSPKRESFGLFSLRAMTPQKPAEPFLPLTDAGFCSCEICPLRPRFSPRATHPPPFSAGSSLCLSQHLTVRFIPWATTRVNGLTCWDTGKFCKVCGRKAESDRPKKAPPGNATHF
jgi:hypothetical protein